MKINKNLKKSIKNQILSGINVITILLILSLVVGCIDFDDETLSGAYSDGAKETLDLNEDLTFLFTLHVGYIAGRPVNQSTAGTFYVDGHTVTFTGSNGVTTTGHIENGAIYIEGTKFTKTE